VIHNPDIAPQVWTLMLTQLLGASPTLTTRMWKLFRETARSGELGAIVRGQMRQDKASMQDLLRLVTPLRLFRVLAKISPEGEPRNQDVLDLEQTILHRACGPHTWR
jgi:hypothetical protein